ncbi:MAG TPA: LptA/OstA family protein [Candidatus Sulfotelmatobacter sp.]|jgi:lipopolysaccharide export system protein LptA|nr:LptA/OstA family protein [Candidatus Sulfotelmatobacter sp.]
MRRSEAAKYARWSAAVALCLAGLTAAVYLGRGWQRHRAKKNAPPPAPAYVDRQLSGISFSKVEGNRTIYTVEASHSTDFKGEAASLLEDVKITVLGKDQDRHDVLHTQSCRYAKSSQNIDCSGLVQMDLMSAADAKFLKVHPEMTAARIVHVETRGVTFERNTGVAKTSEPITFRLPNGTGEATGVEYHSNEGELQLQHDVRFDLSPAPSKNGNATHAGLVEIRGTHLEFNRDSRMMRLSGPAQATAAESQLKAGAFLVELDERFRAQKLIASAGTIGARPELHSQDKKGVRVMNSDSMTATLTQEGKVARIEAQGSVTGSADGTEEKEEMASNKATAEFWPTTGRAKEILLKGAARVHTTSKTTGDSRELQSDAVQMSFAGGTLQEKSRPQMAETLAPGTMIWTNGSAKTAGAGEQTKLQADRFHLDFGDAGKAKLLQASGNVRVERSAPGKGTQTATGKSGVARLEAIGGWSQMELHGDVRLKDSEKSAQADDAMFVKEAQSAVLTGHAQVRDATTETHAEKITFMQSTGEIYAEGSVRSTDYANKPGAVQIGAAPTNVASDTLQGNSKTGRALYQGRARLWQGESTMDADAIELLRGARVLSATGNVRAVFLEAPSATTASPPANQITKKAQLWYVFATSLSYWDKENRAHLEKDVTVQSADQKIRSAAMDIFFARAISTNNGAAGAQQISRAVATGGVTVEQGPRRAIADRGEYTASDGKFVMSGGTPTIFDASEGTTTGRQLTFFLADATIIVDSENGSRTLTKHRVEK